MIERRDEPTKSHTLMRCGGVFKRLLIPESEEELLECCTSYPQAWILGAGSNVLPADGRLARTVIKNSRACRTLESDGRRVFVGSSVRLGAFIRFLVFKSLFGYEYLASVPGTVGGAVRMNAGRGRRTGTSISDYLIRVKMWDGHQVRWLDKGDCGFGYRQSVFGRQDDWVILGAEFDLPDQPSDIGSAKARQRIMETKEWQDLRHPSLGSTFSRISPIAVRQMMGARRGDAAFSDRTPNWLVNLGNAKTSDFLYLIRLAKLRSLLFGVVPHLEIVIWK